MRKTPEQIRKNMQSVRNRDSAIEQMLRKELWRRGLRYRKNIKNVFGKPDIAFVGKKIAVFVDGDFWHGYNWEERRNDFKVNRDFWISKIEGNMKRDRNVTDKLQEDGWIVFRFWGHEIKKNVSLCADKIENALQNR